MKPIKEWFKIKGDETLRIQYPLTKNSVVFDIGGYLGDWTAAIYKKHECHIHVFEPVKIFYDRIEERFRGNKKIKIHNFALGTKDMVSQIYVNADESSLFGKGQGQKTRIRDIVRFIRTNKIRKIDLMKINIEGAEYNLLLKLLASGETKKIRNIQVQFHRNIKGYEEKRKWLREILSETHHLTYDFPFVWENWRLNN